MTGLVDKNLTLIPSKSIVYGNYEGKYHFFNIGLNARNEVHMIACTYGYVHNVTQSDIEDFLLIGSLEEHKHLLECD